MRTYNPYYPSNLSYPYGGFQGASTWPAQSPQNITSYGVLPSQFNSGVVYGSSYVASTSITSTSLSYAQPTVTYAQSAVTYAQPTTSYVRQPVTSYAQSATYAQPTVTYSQPATTYVQPALSYAQPTHAQPTYTKPATTYGIMPSPYDNNWKNIESNGVGQITWSGRDGNMYSGEVIPRQQPSFSNQPTPHEKVRIIINQPPQQQPQQQPQQPQPQQPHQNLTIDELREEIFRRELLKSGIEETLLESIFHKGMAKSNNLTVLEPVTEEVKNALLLSNNLDDETIALGIGNKIVANEKQREYEAKHNAGIPFFNERAIYNGFTSQYTQTYFPSYHPHPLIPDMHSRLYRAITNLERFDVELGIVSNPNSIERILGSRPVHGEFSKFFDVQFKTSKNSFSPSSNQSESPLLQPRLYPKLRLPLLQQPYSSQTSPSPSMICSLGDKPTGTKFAGVSSGQYYEAFLC